MLEHMKMEPSNFLDWVLSNYYRPKYKYFIYILNRYKERKVMLFQEEKTDLKSWQVKWYG